MHVGKLMARLNPANVRFDIGHGGTPELTSTDVAAALAFVERGLGRELLMQVWWPGAGSRDAVLELIERAQMDEWSRRESAMLDATLAVAMRGSRAQAMYSEAHGNRWPNVTVTDRGLRRVADGYDLLRKAVLDEMCGTGICADCHGRGNVANSFGVSLTCGACAGSGHHRVSDRDRAASMQRALSTYQGGWQRVYVWTYQHCMDALLRATRQMMDACE